MSSTDWRGVAGESMDEVSVKASLILRDRSRRLLGSLLRPHKKALQILLAVVLIENAARLAIPYLVKEGIDSGIPPIQRGDGNLSRERRRSRVTRKNQDRIGSSLQP